LYFLHRSILSRWLRSLKRPILPTPFTNWTIVFEAVSTQALLNWDRSTHLILQRIAAIVKLWETSKAFSDPIMMSLMAFQARSCTSMKDSPLGILVIAGSAIHLWRKSFSQAVNS